MRICTLRERTEVIDITPHGNLADFILKDRFSLFVSSFFITWLLKHKLWVRFVALYILDNIMSQVVQVEHLDFKRIWCISNARYVNHFLSASVSCFNCSKKYVAKIHMSYIMNVFIHRSMLCLQTQISYLDKYMNQKLKYYNF